ncbi:MAG: FAD-binding oxidoreductase [Sphaerobacter sp.]|nr:FAD-binding oxidoreductase [Sphaerobacter sp.]
MTQLPPVEVVVVGGGVIGCAASYELSKAGVSVAIVEAREVASGASGASAGGVRQQGRDPRELAIAMRAIARWPSLEAELGADLGYRQDGHLTLVAREEDLPALEQRVRAERARGLGIEVVGRDVLDALVPGLAPDIIAGAWCPTDGHAMPILVTRAFCRAAQRHGATLYERTAVIGLRLQGDRVVGVRTTRGEIACRAVLLAAGAWSRELARTVGLELPIAPHALQMMVTDPMPSRLKPVLTCVGRRLSLKQLPSGAYLLGGGWSGTVDWAGRFGRTRIASLAGSAVDASAVYPLLRRTRIVRAWTGLEAIAADEVPILGPAPGVAGLIIACGFSGHGFALAPCIGELMAELIVTGQTSLPLDALRLERFAA